MIKLYQVKMSSRWVALTVRSAHRIAQPTERRAGRRRRLPCGAGHGIVVFTADHPRSVADARSIGCCRLPGPGSVGWGDSAGAYSRSMHLTLARALEPVLRDVRSSGAGKLRVEDDDWMQYPGMASVMIHLVEGTGAGVSLNTTLHAPAAVAALADQVQEIVIENLRCENRTNWPPCPEHPTTHPLTAAVRGGLAVWRCPLTGRDGAVIGELRRS